MPTRINLPDGSIGEFPDGMPESEIEGVLQKQFGSPKVSPKPADTLGTHGMGSIGDTFKEGFNGLKGLVQPFKDIATKGPERAAYDALVQPSIDEFNTPSQKGVMIGGTNHPTLDKIMRSVPVLGPMTANTDRINQREGFGPAAASLVAPFAASELGGAAFRGLGKIGEEYRSPMISPEEHQASALSKAIQPPVMRTFQDNLSELPKIKDFAAQSGNPLKSQAEFQKAAQGAGDRVWQQEYQPLKDKALANPAPNAFSPGKINIPGPGMTSGNGFVHEATLPEIESRIAEINRITGPAYRMNPTQSAASLERMGQLEDEGRSLRTVLYKNIADANGISPEAVKAIRESGGKLGSIADDTQQAILDRSKKVGRNAEGQTIATPHTLGGLVTEGVNYLRGGREAIADRALRNALDPSEPILRPLVKATGNALPASYYTTLPFQKKEKR